ncbi:hypothetical protein FYK55_00115 [Roseiconus nitratireducens]|uniref:Uncharacterized protein n=1 Tax=Roseiconus nitratireducens TaxID=2605748 RepID=A0A5M6DHF0_9BACT|nr:hypothetical protein [Roseiconus nitratireducens]KAA5546873.1 hypothetical protein FYK55_00115 [Roseiconus nitratireducens]
MSNQLQMQPTFRVELPDELEQVKRRLRAAVRSPELSEHVNCAGYVFDYRIEASQQRFWSPHLSVQLGEATEPGTTEAFCRFSPRPDIWMMVAAVYMVAACCLFGAFVFGSAQWMLGNTPWALAAIPVGLLVILALHVASLVGQRLSQDQMELLRHRWERTLEIAFADRDRGPGESAPADPGPGAGPAEVPVVSG